MGGWPPPIGIEYRIDRAGAWVAVLVSVIAAVSILIGTRGTRDELERLLVLCADNSLTPLIDHTYPLAAADLAIARLASGEGFGKIVVTT